MRPQFLLALLFAVGCIQTGLPISETSSRTYVRKWPAHEPLTLESELMIKDETTYGYNIVVANNTKVDLVVDLSIDVIVGGVKQHKDTTINVPAFKTRVVEGETLFDKLVWGKQASLEVKVVRFTD